MVAQLLTRLTALAAVIALVAGCTSGLETGKAYQPLSSSTEKKLASLGSSPAAGMMVRIYKSESELEVWKETRSGAYRLFKTYEICDWSGDLGPKIAEGDRQSPEGFYSITPGLMNPNSNYYLAFNLGFPNKFDRAHGRTGSNLMVHGDCSSRGCYAVTDENIGEIFALARESFKGGNKSFAVEIYPFRMTAENFAGYQNSPHLAFWKNIKKGHDITNLTARPVSWDVCDGDYGFALDGACGTTSLSSSDQRKLAELEAAEESRLRVAVANYEQQQADKARQLAKAEQEAAEEAAREAAAAERGHAIAAFFGGIFGGGGEPAPAPAQAAASELVAPVPPQKPGS